MTQSNLNAMTIDVEDYFQVAALAETIQYSDWDKWPSRVVNNTGRILDLFDQYGIKATFFILGWVAEREPELVKDIARRGHELASHGYSHQLVYRQTPETFQKETAHSKSLLEDISGRPIDGYRAASYSITRDSLWALDILGELGFKWDSSIFPIHHDRYGIANSPELPYTLVTRNGHELTEFPLTTAKIAGMSVPAAGGGYFRQYPYALSKFLFARASGNGSKPMIFYLHPWEIDPDQPKVVNLSFFSRFRHYTNLQRCENRLRKLLKDFTFGTVSEVLGNTNTDLKVSLDSLKK